MSELVLSRTLTAVIVFTLYLAESATVDVSNPSVPDAISKGDTGTSDSKETTNPKTTASATVPLPDIPAQAKPVSNEILDAPSADQGTVKETSNQFQAIRTDPVATSNPTTKKSDTNQVSPVKEAADGNANGNFLSLAINPRHTPTKLKTTPATNLQIPSPPTIASLQPETVTTGAVVAMKRSSLTVPEKNETVTTKPISILVMKHTLKNSDNSTILENNPETQIKSPIIVPEIQSDKVTPGTTSPQNVTKTDETAITNVTSGSKPSKEEDVDLLSLPLRQRKMGLPRHIGNRVTYWKTEEPDELEVTTKSKKPVSTQTDDYDDLQKTKLALPVPEDPPNPTMVTKFFNIHPSYLKGDDNQLHKSEKPDTFPNHIFLKNHHGELCVHHNDLGHDDKHPNSNVDHKYPRCNFDHDHAHSKHRKYPSNVFMTTVHLVRQPPPSHRKPKLVELVPISRADIESIVDRVSEFYPPYDYSWGRPEFEYPGRRYYDRYYDLHF